MPRPLRIAVVEPPAGSLATHLARLPQSAEVRAYPDLYQQFEDLCRFAPRLLLIDASELAVEDIGALRLLQQSLPAAVLCLAAPAERLVEVGNLGAEFDAELLTLPCASGELAALVASLQAGSGRTRPAVFLDLARGISDEINNPLLFASGHLQLLEAGLDADKDASALTQIRAAREGLERIAATMTKVRQLGEASAARSTPQPLTLASLLRDLCEQRSSEGRSSPPLAIAPEAESHLIQADPTLLRAALSEFLAIAAELADLVEDSSLSLDRSGQGLRLRLELRRTELPEWKLPRSFEPYHLNRTLRGTSHGLGLFLVQTVIHAAGGLATARRRIDGGLDLELLMPTAAPDQGGD